MLIPFRVLCEVVEISCVFCIDLLPCLAKPPAALHFLESVVQHDLQTMLLGHTLSTIGGPRERGCKNHVQFFVGEHHCGGARLGLTVGTQRHVVSAIKTIFREGHTWRSEINCAVTDQENSDGVIGHLRGPGLLRRRAVGPAGGCADAPCERGQDAVLR